jgi:uncharacterized cupin superfamily protein
MAKTAPIASLADLPLRAFTGGEGFQAEIVRVGELLGSDKLGCTLVVVPPGKKAWPYHLHHANEEMFVILEGSGTLRHDGERYPIKAGDVISTGTGVGTAHQIVNSSEAELRYLAISTMIEPDIAEYPDSAKRLMIAGSPPGRRPYPLYVITPNDATADYWQGEE